MNDVCSPIARDNLNTRTSVRCFKFHMVKFSNIYHGDFVLVKINNG